MPVIAGSSIGNQPPPRYLYRCSLLGRQYVRCAPIHPSIHPSNYSMPLFLDAVADLLLMTCCAGADTAPVTCLFIFPRSCCSPSLFCEGNFFIFFPPCVCCSVCLSVSKNPLVLLQTKSSYTHTYIINNNYTPLDRLPARLLTWS